MGRAIGECVDAEGNPARQVGWAHHPRGTCKAYPIWSRAGGSAPAGPREQPGCSA